jgi:hypothetical protein
MTSRGCALMISWILSPMDILSKNRGQPFEAATGSEFRLVQIWATEVQHHDGEARDEHTSQRRQGSQKQYSLRAAEPQVSNGAARLPKNPVEGNLRTPQHCGPEHD